MSNIIRTPIPAQLDSKRAFGQLQGTNYYNDAVHEKFSEAEMARRYAAVREKMERLEVEVLIVTGGPSHWSFWGRDALADQSLGVARDVGVCACPLGG